MDVFVGEVRAFPYAFIPAGWLLCDGSLVSMDTYQNLFSVIGTTYGGGEGTFGLPSLLGSAVIGTGVSAGRSFTAGQAVGSATVALTKDTIPAHTHVIQTQISVERAAQPGSTTLIGSPQYPLKGKQYLYKGYVGDGSAPVTVAMADATITPTGGGVPHPNMSPYLTLVYCINATDPNSIMPVWPSA